MVTAGPTATAEESHWSHRGDAATATNAETPTDHPLEAPPLCPHRRRWAGAPGKAGGEGEAAFLLGSMVKRLPPRTQGV